MYEGYQDQPRSFPLAKAKLIPYSKKAWFLKALYSQLAK